MLEPKLHVVALEQVPFPEGRDVVSGPEQAARIFRELIGDRDRECFVVLHLNSKNRVISAEVVSVGSLVSSVVHPREVFKAAFLQNAAAIICGHNHPSNDPMPSIDDREVFGRLRSAGELLGVTVLDFVVVTASGYSSKLDLEA